MVRVFVDLVQREDRRWWLVATREMVIFQGELDSEPVSGTVNATPVLSLTSQRGPRHQPSGATAPVHFTEYFVNAPPAWLSEFGPSAAYTLPSASTATPSPAVP